MNSYAPSATNVRLVPPPPCTATPTPQPNTISGILEESLKFLSEAKNVQKSVLAKIQGLVPESEAVAGLPSSTTMDLLDGLLSMSRDILRQASEIANLQ